MAKSFLGIDVSESYLKIVELEKKKETVFLKNYHILELKDLLKDTANEEKDSLILSQIETFIKEHKIKTKKANIAISGQSVFTRLVKLPAVEKHKLEQIVQYEAQQQIPFPINEVVWSYQVLEQAEETGELNALLVAVKTEVADKTFSSFNSKKFDLEVMDVSSLALCNALQFSGLIDNKSCKAVLNLGAQNTYIVIEGNGLIWTRSIPMGGSTITNAIAEELHIKKAEAEKIKREFKGVTIEEPLSEEMKKVGQIIDKNISRLMAEISRSIGFYRTQFLGGNVEKFLVTGGGSLLSGLIPIIKERYDKAEVERVDVFSNIAADAKLLRDKDFKNDKYLLGEAVGLALRGVVDCHLKIDLIPSELKRKKLIAAQQKYLLASGICLVLYLLAYVLFSQQIVTINSTSLKDIADIVQESKRLEAERKSLLGEMESIDKEHAVLKECARLRSFWLAALLEMETIIPKNIWLINIYPFSGKEQLEQQAAPDQKQRRVRGGNVAQTEASTAFTAIDTIIVEGKTTGMYKDLIQFRDNLKKSLYFDESEDGIKIISAKPPVKGEREFVFSIKLKQPLPQTIEP